MEEREYWTVQEIARLHGVTERQADYAVRSYHIEPTRRVGIIRLFNADAVEHIRSAINRISDGTGAARV